MHKSIIATSLIIGLLATALTVGVLAWSATLPCTQPASQQQVVGGEEIDTSDWLTYRNEEYGFEFKYPGDWVFIEPQEDLKESGVIAYFQTLDTAKLIKEKKLSPGYEYNLVINNWDTINNDFAKGGSWIGEREYINLVDYFTDTNTPKQKIGQLNIDGQKAYEVTIGGYGLNYGIMFENNGIFELSFERIWDKSKLSEIENEVIFSIKFIK